MRMCGGENCKKKKRMAVYLVNHRPMCQCCLEKWLDIHGVENYSIYRISEREEDYATKTHLRPTRKDVAVSA
jgi:hypothetical protein